MNPQWAGQEATAFPDNWTIGMSFYHNVFAREHNQFVDEFRRRAARTPDADSGLRNPATPGRVIRYRDVTDDELFEAARLVVAAEIAKIHTIEWTTQLLYDEPLFLRHERQLERALRRQGRAVKQALAAGRAQARRVGRPREGDQLVLGLRGRPGHLRPGQPPLPPSRLFQKHRPVEPRQPGRRERRRQPLRLAVQLPRGVRHRLPPASAGAGPDRVPRARARSERDRAARCRSSRPSAARRRGAMHDGGLANWALQHGPAAARAPAAAEPSAVPAEPPSCRGSAPRRSKIDVLALDIIRDRERGVPRFNEFRRQYGLQQLTSFDDFVDERLPAGLARARRPGEAGRSCCARSTASTAATPAKVITAAQLNADGSAITDCLGQPDGSHGRQHRGRRHGRRLARRADAAARLRHLGDAVPGLHPERLAPAVQRPLLHLELPARVLHHARRRLGEQQRPDRDAVREGRRRTATGWRCRRSSGCCCAPCRSSRPSSSTWSTPSTRGRATAASTTRSNGKRARGRRRTRRSRSSGRGKRLPYPAGLECRGRPGREGRRALKRKRNEAKAHT